jgi:hypothetical protein
MARKLKKICDAWTTMVGFDAIIWVKGKQVSTGGVRRDQGFKKHPEPWHPDERDEEQEGELRLAAHAERSKNMLELRKCGRRRNEGCCVATSGCALGLYAEWGSLTSSSAPTMPWPLPMPPERPLEGLLDFEGTNFWARSDIRSSKDMVW